MVKGYSFGTAVLPARLSDEQGKGVARSKAVLLTVEASRLLRGAQAQLAQAQVAELGADVFEHAHLAALRTAGALIEGVTKGVRSRKVESLWQKVSRMLPEFAQWAVVFEEGASIRLRIEAGELTALPDGGEWFWLQQSQAFLAEATEFFGMDANESVYAA